MSNARVADLRRALSSHVGGRGRRYATALRARAIGFAEQRRAEGRSWSEVAAEVGLRVETVRRWCVERGPQMRAVEVVAERAEHGVTLVTAAGLRVEGLSVEEVVAVLRALG